MNILFTCAGRRNYLLHFFKEIIGTTGKTIAVDNDALAPALTDADIALTVPSLYDEKYISTLIDIVRKYEVDLVIPLNDLELPIMAGNKEEFEHHGARVVISSPELIALCADKWKTYNFFADLNIATPHTFIDIDATLMALEDNKVQFPIILKPRWGFGSVGIHEVKTEGELRLAYRLLLTKMDTTLMASINSDTLSNQIIFQEKINGVEYGIDIVNDFKGNYHRSYARKKLAMRAGETDKAQSVIDDRFEKVAKKIGEATRHIGLMDCDFFLKDGEIFFLEMNPRFGGGYPFSHHAGVNVPGIYLEWSKGNSQIKKYDNYKADRIFSKCERLSEIRKFENFVEKNSHSIAEN